MRDLAAIGRQKGMVFNMYAYIKGTIEDIGTDRVIIECGGIGYNVLVPSSVLVDLGCTGKTLKLYTYLSVKEDSMTLFGFLAKEDLELFKMLITVSGIGPKGALGLMGAMSGDDLRFAIMSGDAKAISKAPGIGAKTAGKLILELKDKFDPAAFIKIREAGYDNADEAVGSGIISEAVMALTALGYGQGESLRAVRQCQPEKFTEVEGLIKAALKKML